MDMEQQDGIGVGHNNPPDDEAEALRKIDVEKLVDLDALLPALALKYNWMFERRDELIHGVEEWVKNHTPPSKKPTDAAVPLVGDEQDLEDTTDFVNQIKGFLSGEIEVNRKKVKGPLDKAGKLIQKFFVQSLHEKLEAAMQPVVDAQSIALVEKEARNRRRLQEEAWEKAQLANRLAIQARRAQGVAEKETLLDRAIQIEDEAASLQKASEASAAELSRTRTDLGEVTGLRTDWKFEVENILDLLQAIISGQQPVELVMVNEVEINKLIRPKNGVRKIPGIHIIEIKKAR